MKLKTIQDIFETPRPNVQPNEEQNFGLLICEFSKNVSNVQALNQEAAMIEGTAFINYELFIFAYLFQICKADNSAEHR